MENTAENGNKKEQNSRYCVFVILFNQWTMALIMGINATALNPAMDTIGQFVNISYVNRYSDYPTESKIKNITVVAQSSLAWGSLIGSLLVRIVIAKCSRKGGIALSHALNLVSIVLMSPVAKFAESYEALIAGRIVNGISRGIGYSVVAVMVAETTCRRRLANYQGPYTYLLFVGAAIGVGLGHSRVCGNIQWWPLLTAATAPFSITYFLLYPWMPQTPVYFMMQRNEVKSLEILRKLRYGSIGILEREITMLKAEISHDTRTRGARLRDILRSPTQRKQILSAILTLNCTQLVGTQAIFFYSNNLFREAGVPEEYITYASIGIFAQCVIPGIMAILIVRQIGTRKLFLIGTGISAVGLTIFTLASILKNRFSPMPYVALGSAMLFLFGNYLGIQITTFALPSELTTQATRPPAMLVGGIIYWVTACMVGTVLPYTLSAWGAYAYIPFIVAALVEFIYGFVFLPETFKKTVEEIQANFRPGVTNLFEAESYFLGTD
uniref:solute carrier family 2, facilitated glucose transporter member 5-like n=1 Tax=Styela clava TaxID=7725 RepID=UPI00193A01C8|nr:solute carrier family 2, facilitated glucose transporter member 5-like [Styela clava]